MLPASPLPLISGVLSLVMPPSTIAVAAPLSLVRAISAAVAGAVASITTLIAAAAPTLPAASTGVTVKV